MTDNAFRIIALTDTGLSIRYIKPELHNIYSRDTYYDSGNLGINGPYNLSSSELEAIKFGTILGTPFVVDERTKSADSGLTQQSVGV